MFRVLISAPAGFSVLVTLVFISFFINHAGYLVLGQFDYQYNMSANIAVGKYWYPPVGVMLLLEIKNTTKFLVNF